MVDREINMTTEGTIADLGSTSATFDLEMAGGGNTLSSYTDASYLFEINIVMYASVTHGNAYRGYIYAYKKAGVVGGRPIVTVFNEGDAGGTLTVTSSVVSAGGPIRVTMTTTTNTPARSWRAFIKCYIREP
jgi:hypothetical protein